MKRIFSITISMLFFYSAYSQSLVVTGSNFVPTSDACLQSHSSLTVKNISTDTLNILCQKVIIDTTLGTDNNFCWGANCYGVNTYISTDYNELLPGEGDNIDFAGYYDAYCDPASAVIEYCFYPESDVTDRACITITYNGSATLINDNTLSSIVGDFYPNPANDIVYFTFNGDLATLKLIDILGNNAKEILLSQQGIQKLDLSDMSKGIYFGNLIVNGEVVSIKKLIVK